MITPRLLIFASGTKNGGGSGFENLVTSPDLNAQIVGVVSNHEHGGVRARADRLGVPFIYFPGPFNTEGYRNILNSIDDNVASISRSDFSGQAPWPHSGFTGWVALSGWLKKVVGLDPARTFNIHPALLSFENRRFGGAGLYGHHVHAAVKNALDSGAIGESGVSMHFVTPDYDEGPIFFEHRVPIKKGMTADEIGAVVNQAEHAWQPKITNMVVHQQIRWDGKNAESLVVPARDTKERSDLHMEV